MPGAVIVADQPTGAGPGSPGVSRNDLWQGQAVQLSVGVGGNSTYLWELLAAPPGSASTVSGATSAVASFTPDVRGSYRVRLTTNGGGPGNVQTLVYRARYSNTGVLLAYGLATPAYGERAGEDNAGGNTRGYAPQLDAFVDSYASFRLGLIANALVTDGSGVARISTSLIQNESNPLCVIRSASGDLQTNTASAVQVPLVELEAGDVMTADLFVTVRNSSGTIAGRWRVSALLHHQGGVAQIIGGVTPDADAKKTDVGLDATLIVSASTLYLQVSPLLTPLRWGWESRYQQQGFS